LGNFCNITFKIDFFAPNNALWRQMEVPAYFFHPFDRVDDFVQPNVKISKIGLF